MDDGIPFDYAFKGSGKGKCPPGVNVMGLRKPEDPIPPEALPRKYNKSNSVPPKKENKLEQNEDDKK